MLLLSTKCKVGVGESIALVEGLVDFGVATTPIR
jgi:hypothetical protein